MGQVEFPLTEHKNKMLLLRMYNLVQFVVASLGLNNNNKYSLSRLTFSQPNCWSGQ